MLALAAGLILFFAAALPPTASAAQAREAAVVSGCHRVAPTAQITGAVRAAYQRGRGLPAGEADFLVLVKCQRHRWYALASVSAPRFMEAIWAKDPDAQPNGVAAYMYQDGPDRFLGSGPAAWRHLGDTGGAIVCGRERGMFPRQVIRVAGRRCDRDPPGVIPLIPDTWEGCPEEPRGILEVAARGLQCEAATDYARAIIAHGGPRPEGIVSAGHRRWRCTTTGPVAPTGGPDMGKATWYVARCDLGRRHVGIGTSG